MWDWLTESLASEIISKFEALASGVTSLTEIAKQTPKEFNPTLWNAVNSFNRTAVLPIGWSLLSMFLLFELAAVMKRTDARGMDAIYWVSMVLLKIVIAKMIMENMSDIIMVFFQLSGEMVRKGGNLFTPSSSAGVLDDTKKAALADAVSKLNVLQCLGLWIEVELIGMAGNVCAMISKALIGLRFIEIYVFTAVASIPMSTLVSEKYGEIGRNYLKRMAALAVHVIFIIIVLYMYSLLVNGSTLFTTDDILSIGWSMLGYSILAVIALFQTVTWAKGLMGVH